ncbi:ATP-binding cassette subfamily C member 4-like [Anthonomus grandis grandis]|uniref:ATP-binding cassette subfamily C member 4-like n=1 Tax=Anthonomus grandis grandis TaxID=2921223 RepID=UPI0021662C0E|nr:ATP-binding cassette subfamily C member 4-like [Anthonomus grandis grandis]
MDTSKKFDNPSPEIKANFCNRLFFCWVLPFFKTGYKKDLEVKDIYNSTSPDLSGPLGDALEKNWDEEVQRTRQSKKKKGEKPRLKRAIFKTFAKSYFFYGGFIFIQSVVIRMLIPIFLAYYIQFYQNPRESFKDVKRGWLLGGAVVGLSFTKVILEHYCNMGVQRIGMRVRVAACSLIYRKLLRLNQASLGKTAAGQLVNLLSNDVIRFDMISWFLHYFWITPVLFVIAFYIMYTYVGLAALPSMGAITIQAVLAQGYLSKLQGRLRARIALLTDNRVKLMSEITSGIQVIKMYAWERPFEKIVELARKLEIDIVQKTSYIKGFSLALMLFTERATLYIAVITWVLMGPLNKDGSPGSITGEVVFSMAQLLNTVQLYMAIFFPLALATWEECKVSMKRIEDFLSLEENDDSECLEGVKENAGLINLSHATASWLPNPIVETLFDVNMELKPGTLCCVVGPVGSGKSSLLQVILKELPLNSGSLNVIGEVSYASQEPWLFVSSVRQNILFGVPYVKERYKMAVQACALKRDFEQLPHGDRTLVGERGAALSGGQRARVALARAVYREADIYLLDDPLSAVDAHVAKHLFEGCIRGHLSGKTRILVTHQVQFLKGADLIVVMNNGKIEQMGSYEKLQDELAALSREIEQQHQVHAETHKIDREQTPKVDDRDRGLSLALQSIASLASWDEPEETDELLERGALKTSTYVEYYKSGSSICVLIILILLFIIAQVSCNAADMWITYWTTEEDNKRQQNHTNPSNFTSTSASTTEIIENTTYSVYNNSLNIEPIYATGLDNTSYIYIYTILIFSSIILTTARSSLFMKVCMNASKALHNKMFNCILKAPMKFFDTNPSGRILNRFSKDMGAVDEVLPKVVLETLQIFFIMVGILAMVFIKSPYMIIPAVILGSIFWYARVIYLKSGQDIKRLEGATRAPVFSHVSASLYGLPTIRAFKAQSLIVKEFDTLQDQHTGTWFLFGATSESLGFYLDVISTIFLAFTTFQFLLVGNEELKAADVGLVISQTLALTGMLQYGVRQSAEVSSTMTSVERVLQYTKLDYEGPWEPLPGDRPPLDWPQKGRVTFTHAFLRYSSESPPSIRDLNVEFKPGEKIGVVGRTGAGKSSLVATLFRLAQVDGVVAIDGIDTAKVGLRILRTAISIIPQVPILFSATLRYNLDPFEKCSDEQLWKALERVELKQNGVSLDTPVSEGGGNFSAGQRQLICLARAIVRNNKVLVMDEATANVDRQTDSLIQKTIREAFKDCTVITIAHRLNTIADYDKVLVMDAGKAVEFAPPHELLENPNGYFAKMVAQTGPVMEGKLKEIAREAYERMKQSDGVTKEEETTELIVQNGNTTEKKDQ